MSATTTAASLLPPTPLPSHQSPWEDDCSPPDITYLFNDTIERGCDHREEALSSLFDIDSVGDNGLANNFLPSCTSDGWEKSGRGGSRSTLIAYAPPPPPCHTTNIDNQSDCYGSFSFGGSSVRQLGEVLEESRAGGGAGNHHHTRDDEVSCVGGSCSSTCTTMSRASVRSAQRQAKRERRQNAKWGDAQLAVAGSGDMMSHSNPGGGSMKEILHQLPHATPKGAHLGTGASRGSHDWIAPLINLMGDLPNPHTAAADRLKSNSKRNDLRSGKRNLMSSWCNNIHAQHQDSQISSWIDDVPTTSATDRLTDTSVVCDGNIDAPSPPSSPTPLTPISQKGTIPGGKNEDYTDISQPPTTPQSQFSSSEGSSFVRGLRGIIDVTRTATSSEEEGKHNGEEDLTSPAAVVLLMNIVSDIPSTVPSGLPSTTTTTSTRNSGQFALASAHLHPTMTPQPRTSSSRHQPPHVPAPNSSSTTGHNNNDYVDNDDQVNVDSMTTAPSLLLNDQYRDSSSNARSHNSPSSFTNNHRPSSSVWGGGKGALAPITDSQHFQPSISGASRSTSAVSFGIRTQYVPRPTRSTNRRSTTSTVTLNECVYNLEHWDESDLGWFVVPTDNICNQLNTTDTYVDDMPTSFRKRCDDDVSPPLGSYHQIWSATPTTTTTTTTTTTDDCMFYLPAVLEGGGIDSGNTEDYSGGTTKVEDNKIDEGSIIRDLSLTTCTYDGVVVVSGSSHLQQLGIHQDLNPLLSAAANDTPLQTRSSRRLDASITFARQQPQSPHLSLTAGSSFSQSLGSPGLLRCNNSMMRSATDVLTAFFDVSSGTSGVHGGVGGARCCESPVLSRYRSVANTFESSGCSFPTTTVDREGSGVNVNGSINELEESIKQQSFTSFMNGNSFSSGFRHPGFGSSVSSPILSDNSNLGDMDAQQHVHEQFVHTISKLQEGCLQNETSSLVVALDSLLVETTRRQFSATTTPLIDNTTTTTTIQVGGGTTASNNNNTPGTMFACSTATFSASPTMYLFSDIVANYNVTVDTLTHGASSHTLQLAQPLTGDSARNYRRNEARIRQQE